MKVDIGPLATVSERLIAAVDQMTPSGNTALYDTVRAATERMAGAREREWINAVVVLNDGVDTAYPGRDAEAQALAKLTADLQQRELKVPVFIIGFGLNTSPRLDCPAGDQLGLLRRLFQRRGHRPHVHKQGLLMFPRY